MSSKDKAVTTDYCDDGAAGVGRRLSMRADLGHYSSISCTIGHAGISVLSDTELDGVTGGKHGGVHAGGGTVVQIVEISIGEIVATGHSRIILNLAGLGSVSHKKGK